MAAAEVKTKSKNRAESTSQYCTFRIAGSLYGFEIKYVKEINPEFRVTPVPHSKSYISGLVNVRGEIYLIFNLRNCLGFETIPVDDEHRIILFKNIVADPCGIIVDQMADVVAVRSGTIESGPLERSADASLSGLPDVKGMSAQLIQGVHQLESEVLIVLSVPALLNLTEQ